MKKMYKTLRRRLLVFLTHGVALPVLKCIRAKKIFPYTAAQLRQLPPRTVGHDLAEMLDRQGLTLLPYYEKHDIKHLLLGFGMDEKGEACLQCFMLGNGRVSFPVLATVLYALLTMPEYHKAMKQAYRAGKQCTCLVHCDWFALLPQPTQIVKDRLLQPASNQRSLHI
jgi:ubiquinone biosynthesis protein Coq4